MDKPEAVVVASNGLVLELFPPEYDIQLMLVIRVSRSRRPPTLEAIDVSFDPSFSSLPRSGFGLWPLASQINTPDPLAAAKYREFELTELLLPLVGWKARDDIEFKDFLLFLDCEE